VPGSQDRSRRRFAVEPRDEDAAAITPRGWCHGADVQSRLSVVRAGGFNVVVIDVRTRGLQ